MFAPKPRRQMLCFCSFRIFKYILYSSPKSPKIFSQYLPREKIWNPNSAIWVCLKIGYIPNEIAINSGIMISKTIGENGVFSIFRHTHLGKKPSRLLKPVRNLLLHFHHIAHGLLNRAQSTVPGWRGQPGGTTNYNKQKETAVTQKAQVTVYNFLNEIRFTCVLQFLHGHHYALAGTMFVLFTFVHAPWGSRKNEEYPFALHRGLNPMLNARNIRRRQNSCEALHFGIEQMRREISSCIMIEKTHPKGKS